MSNVQELADRLAIRELIERYSSALTTRAWDDMGSTFHPDAVWSVAAPFDTELTTRKGIQEGISGMVSAFDFLIQLTHSIVIDLDGDSASAVSVIKELGRNSADKTAFSMLGTYHDELIKVDGCWLFSKRAFKPIYIDPNWLPGDVVG